MSGDTELTGILLVAGGNIRATTRLGGYTPLHLASRAGHAAVIDALVKAGASASAATATGATPLMLASTSGSVDAAKRLLAHGADVNAKELAQGETALMFASALDRQGVVQLLIEGGADANVASKVIDVSTLVPPEEVVNEEVRRGQNNQNQGGNRGGAVGGVPGITRPYRYGELIGKQGGLTALHFAARQGAFATVRTLVEKGADVNALTVSDKTSPILIAILNGHFDLAKYLLDHGANPNLASDAGAAPLYAVLNVQWAPRSFYPQPRAQLQQQIGYLDLVKALLDKGADVNARVQRKLWYTQYNFDLLRTDESGATPFWKAAYAADVDAMKVLLAAGADPNIPTIREFGRQFEQGGTRATNPDASPLLPLPPGGPGIMPLQAAAGAGYGEGFAGNAHRFAAGGLMAAVKFLIEEVGVDVNTVDHDGNTAVHHAASRGDNEMILYLVSKGADVKRVNRSGQTTVDMANGPVQRTQPYPETI
jgi:ankyrin repeat protein